MSSTILDPCTSIRCAPNEVCVLRDAEHAICLLRNDIEIQTAGATFYFNKKKREIKTASVCSSDECKQGECEILTPNAYKCHCNQMSIVGANCDLFLQDVDPCSSNPCYGNAECVNLNDNQYECKCKAGRAGFNCIGHAVIIFVCMISFQMHLIHIFYSI